MAGHVELIGTAATAPGKPMLVAPFTHGPCVYWEWKVEEWKKRGKNHQWVTVASDRSKLPFGLRDDTGVALVDPEDADMPAPTHARYGSGWGKDPPASVMDDLAKVGISHENWLGMNKRMRFSEGRLVEGTPLYVLGNATRPDDATGAGNDALVVRRKGDGAFLVSTSSEKALLRNWTLGFWALLLLGIGAAAFGTAMLVGVA